MNVIHFGAGNIGRGFIVPILKKSNNINQVSFLDINEQLITKLKQEKTYKVFEVGLEIKEYIVTDFRAYISDEIFNLEMKNIINNVDLITISISQQNLKNIIKYIKYIIENKNKLKELIVMCCENGIRVSSFFKKQLIQEKIDLQNVYFVDAVVDRIAPSQNQDTLDVKVEEYFSWIVDELQWPKNIKKIESIKYSNKLDSEINKKICILNGSHAAISWYRWQIDNFKVNILQDVINQIQTKEFIEELFSELVNIISVQFELDESQLTQYCKDILLRFNNKNLIDELGRIGRNPITKLQKDERILKPLLFALKNKLKCIKLLETFNNGLLYSNPLDQEAVELSKKLKSSNKQETIKKYIKNLNSYEISLLMN